MDEKSVEAIRRNLRYLGIVARKAWHHSLILVRYWKFFCAVIFLSFVTGYWWHYTYMVERQTRLVDTPPPKIVEQAYPHLILPGSSLHTTLKGLGVKPKTIFEMVKASKPVIDLARLRAGTRFRLIHLTDPTSDVVGIEFQLTPVELVQVNFVNGAWSARAITEAVTTKMVTFSGVVRENLWLSAEMAKMDADLIIQLAEIFAWQVDLGREVRLGDRWRLSVEQKLVRDKPVGWGSILAAEYLNGKRSYEAILFKVSEGKSAYFSPDGSSCRRAFLKSPLRFGRITSGFQNARFHPVLKISRPHMGVDYAAPRGTPVRAVGDGVVTYAGWNGGSGRTLKIKHGAKFQTAYLHLNGFEKGIKVGARVQQGQSVAFVGATGLATGPHLHFEFSVNGKVMDPTKVDSPPAEPVPAEKMAEFKIHAASVLRGLPDWQKTIVAKEVKADETL